MPINELSKCKGRKEKGRFGRDRTGKRISRDGLAAGEAMNKL